MERNAGTHDLHVLVVILRQPLAWTERAAVLHLELDFLLEQEVRQFFVGRELVTERVHDPLEEIPQRPLARFDVHT